MASSSAKFPGAILLVFLFEARDLWKRVCWDGVLVRNALRLWQRNSPDTGEAQELEWLFRVVPH